MPDVSRDMKEIEELITDELFQNLKYRREKANSNLFGIVGRSHTEMWHSAFISWLLDPASSLRLGHYPITRLLIYYAIKKNDIDLTLRDIYKLNLDDVVFTTEKNAGEKKRIDVYGEGKDIIIVIENKVNALEGDGQTQAYYDYVEKYRLGNGGKAKKKAFYFFITADQSKEPTCKEYVKMSYQDMYDCIISSCIQHPQVPEEARFLLEQYAANLTRTIHNSDMPMALVNADLCNKIYDRHAGVLDRMYELVSNEEDVTVSPEPVCMAYDHYADVFDEIFISVDKYDWTPDNNNRMRRQRTGFTDLHRLGKVEDGQRFFMEYDGDRYEAVIAVVNNGEDCYFHPLDEKGEEYRDKTTGEVWGYYDNPFQAAVDVVNDRRRKRGGQEEIRVLRDGIGWTSEDGQELRELMG